MNTFAHRLAKGTGWAFLGKAGAMFFGICTNALLARLLSPSDLGAYFLVMSIGAVAVLVGQFGQNQVVVRFIAEGAGSGMPAKSRDAIHKAFIITLVFSGVVSSFYIIFDEFWASVLHAPIIASVSGLLVIWIVTSALRSLVAESFRGFRDIRLASVFEAPAYTCLFLGLLILGWFLSRDIHFYDVMQLSVMAAIITALWALWVLWKKVMQLPSGSPLSYQEMIHTGWPLLISNIVIVLITQAGLWIVSMISGPSDVALYGAAFRLVALLQMPLLILNSVLPPMIAELYVQGRKLEAEKSLRLITSAALVPASALFVVFLFRGEDILSLLYGGYYAAAFWILIILGGGIMANAWAGFCGPVLMMTGHQKVLMVISLVTGVFTVLLAFILGYIYGAEGVAASMAFGMALQHLLMLLAVKRYIGIWTHAGGLVSFVRRQWEK